MGGINDSFKIVSQSVSCIESDHACTLEVVARSWFEHQYNLYQVAVYSRLSPCRLACCLCARIAIRRSQSVRAIALLMFISFLAVSRVKTSFTCIAMVLKERNASDGEALGAHTYPAWSFGQRHRAFNPPPGPGAGRYDASVPNSNKTLAYREELGTRGPLPVFRGEPISGDRYLKPGYLSTETKGREWSFGYRRPDFRNTNPGPGTYDLGRTGRKQAHATWGPPPSSRQSGVFSPGPDNTHKDLGDNRGPLMASRLRTKTDYVPGANDYQPPSKFPPIFSRCTFGHRKPLYKANDVPGPNQYPPTTTIAAATMRGSVAPLMAK